MVSTSNEPRTCAGTAAAHGLIDGLPHAAPVSLSSQALALSAAAGSTDLEGEVVGPAGDQARAGAGAAVAHGLIDGLRHATPVVQQCAPVHHDLRSAALQAAAALRPVCHDGQLRSCVLILGQERELSHQCPEVCLS